MTMPGEVSKRDIAYAELFSRVSRGLSRVRPLQHIVVGPTAVLHGWQRIAAPANSFVDWVKFLGDPAVPRVPVPRLYKTIGVLSIDRLSMSDTAVDSPDISHAIAIKLGDAVVVGPLNPHAHFAVDPENEKRLLGGLRIGHDDVEALGGAWVPGIRNFVQAPSERHELVTAALASAHVPIV
jgi:hypothetical protein